MMLNAIFSNISVTGISQWSVVLVEKTGKSSNIYRLPEITVKLLLRIYKNISK
jgi:hypothetical protein